jgi:hypothetical protein
MYCIVLYFNFYAIVFSILFDTHEIVKSEMVKLTGRDKTDVDNTDVVVG